MKESNTIEYMLEKIRKETEMRAEAFYQKYNILPELKKDNAVFDLQKEDELSTTFSNKTTNLY